MLMLSAGVIYLFPAYSADLAVTLKYDNTQLNTVGTAGDLGTWFNPLGGWFADRYGPRATAVMAALMSLIGFGAVGLSCDGVFPASHWFVSASVGIFSQGAGWAYLAGMKAALTNFHLSERGSIVGTLVCFFALSSAVLGHTYRSALKEPFMPLSGAFFVFALLLCLTQVACSVVIGSPRPAAGPMSECEARRLRSITTSGVLLSVSILLVTLFDLLVRPSRAIRVLLWLFLIALVACIAGMRQLLWRWWPATFFPARSFTDEDEPRGHVAPTFGGPTELAEKATASSLPQAVAVVGVQPQPSPEAGDAGLEEAASPTVLLGTTAEGANTNENDAAMTTAASVESSGSDPNETPRNAQRGDNASEGVTIAAALQSVNFWLLWVLLLTLIGYGIVLINNVSTLVASLEEVPRGAHLNEVEGMERRVGSLVALFSVANAWGRMFVGFLADRFAASFPRCAWLIACAVVLLFSNFITLATMSFGGLLLSVPLAGAGVGGTFSLLPVVVSELFGVRLFASFWAMYTLAPAATTVVLSIFLAGSISDAKSEESAYYVRSRRFCLGEACYRTTFLLTLGTGLVSLALAVLLAARVHHRRSVGFLEAVRLAAARVGGNDSFE